MINSLWIAALVVILFFCFACTKTVKTPEFFLLHPEHIQSTYNECVDFMEKNNTRIPNECISVLHVIPIFKAYLNELVMNSKLYGMRIMQAQMQIADGKKQMTQYQAELKKLQSEAGSAGQIEDLKKKIRKTQNDLKKLTIIVESRQALLRMIRQ